MTTQTTPTRIVRGLRRSTGWLAIALVGLSLIGCRGGRSTKPQVHIVPNMDWQASLEAQESSAFPGWKDNRASRLPVEGTVAQGTIEWGRYDVWKLADDSYVQTNPVPKSAEVLESGRKWFEITCAVCHGESGRGGNGPDGHGLVGRRWPVAVPGFIVTNQGDDRVAELSDGEYYEVIRNGKGTMPRYDHMLSPEDRWAIVHYINALQLQAEN